MARIPINIMTGTLQKEEMIVGIDLGTTNSLVAIIHPETRQPMVLKDIDQSALLPSIIHLGTQGISVGQEAKAFLQSDPSNTIYSVKRLMGKSYKDITNVNTPLSYSILDDNTDSLVKVRAGDQFYSPVELSSFILKELKLRAEHLLKTQVNKCVITVPAYFNDTQRQATRDAGKLAGLEVLRIINEPTAAVLAYGFGNSKGESRNIAVYDLGGGTFDISIVKITDGVFDVLSTHGDTYLGGDDFDNAIAGHFYQQLETGVEINNEEKGLLQQIRQKAEEAKKLLGSDPFYETEIHGRNVSISAAEFEELTRGLIDRTLDSCKKALADSGLDKKEIAAVVMIGGSTRMPRVKKQVRDFFETEVFDQINPDEAVALGAAIQADILAGNNREMLLLDVTPLSLGLETIGGLMDVLIPRNNKIPSRASRQYTTQKDGQTGIIISVYQGERDLVKDNRKLAEFTLSGIPAMPAGLPKVEISFMINADGILQVKAQELRSGSSQQIEVKPQYGLSDQDVETMLLASLTHAKEDIQQRSLIEAISEAETMLQLTENFLHKHNVYITDEEYKATREAIERLRSAIEAKNKDGILAATEELNHISTPYAERVMDRAVAQALKGKTV